MTPPRDNTEDVLDELLDKHAQRSASTTKNDEPLARLLNRVDALEFDRERKLEAEEVLRSYRAYLADKRSELASLRTIRMVAVSLALTCLAFVGGCLFYELWYGLEPLNRIVKSETLLAAYVGASLAFVLAILLVLVRGAFGAIKDSENQSAIPPHFQELVEAVKKLAKD